MASLQPRKTILHTELPSIIAVTLNMSPLKIALAYVLSTSDWYLLKHFVVHFDRMDHDIIMIVEIAPVCIIIITSGYSFNQPLTFMILCSLFFLLLPHRTA